MTSQTGELVRKTLEYATQHAFEISDEKAFSIYFAFFYLEKMRVEGINPVFEFERHVFKEAKFPQFFTEKERLDILVHIEGKRVGFEFKYPKVTDQQSTKKRAEIYQAICRLVHLTGVGFLYKGILICATNNPAVYSEGESKLYPTHNGYYIDKNSYILPLESPNKVISHHSYGKIWNCKAPNSIRFQWNTIQGHSYQYLSPIEISNVTS